MFNSPFSSRLKFLLTQQSSPGVLLQLASLQLQPSHEFFRYFDHRFSPPTSANLLQSQSRSSCHTLTQTWSREYYRINQWLTNYCKQMGVRAESIRRKSTRVHGYMPRRRQSELIRIRMEPVKQPADNPAKSIQCGCFGVKVLQSLKRRARRGPGDKAAAFNAAGTRLGLDRTLSRSIGTDGPSSNVSILSNCERYVSSRSARSKWWRLGSVSSTAVCSLLDGPSGQGINFFRSFGSTTLYSF